MLKIQCTQSVGNNRFMPKVLGMQLKWKRSKWRFLRFSGENMRDFGTYMHIFVIKLTDCYIVMNKIYV